METFLLLPRRNIAAMKWQNGVIQLCHPVDPPKMKLFQKSGSSTSRESVLCMRDI